MRDLPGLGIRAVVRREAGSWWAELPLQNGAMVKLDLSGHTKGETVSSIALSQEVPAPLGPFLVNATVVNEMSQAGADRSNGRDDHENFSSIGRLLAAVWPNFVETEGHVLIKAGWWTSQTLSQFSDKTGAEAFVNHVHLNDPLRDSRGRLRQRLTRRQCFQIAEMWMLKLKAQFPEREFVVYLFVQGNDTHLRFHTLRKGEPLWTDLTLMSDEPFESAAVWFV